MEESKKWMHLIWYMLNLLFQILDQNKNQERCNSIAFSNIDHSSLSVLLNCKNFTAQESKWILIKQTKNVVISVQSAFNSCEFVSE